MVRKLLCFWTMRVVAAVAVGMAATGAGQAQTTNSPPVWTVPEVGALPDDDHGRLVRRAISAAIRCVVKGGADETMTSICWSLTSAVPAGTADSHQGSS